MQNLSIKQFPNKMFKVKFLLYLLTSDLFVNANTANLTTSDRIKARRRTIGSIRPDNNESSAVTPVVVGTVAASILNVTTSHPPGSVDISSTPQTTAAPTTSDSPVRLDNGFSAINSTDITTGWPNFTTTAEPLIKRFSEAITATSKPRSIVKPQESPHVFDVGYDSYAIYKSYVELEELQRKDSNWMRIEKKQIHVTPTPNRTIPFDNEEFLVTASSHGLYFLEIGTAFIFTEQFDHFFSFELPKPAKFDKTFLLDTCDKLCLEQPCYAHVEETKIIAYKNVTYECFVLLHYYDKSISEFQEIMDNAYEEFNAKVRDKRFVGGLVAGAVAGAVTGAVVGGIAGYFAAKHVVSEVKGKLEELQGSISTLAQATKVNSELLLGLTKEVFEMEKEMNNKIKLITDNTRLQIEYLEKSVRENSRTLEAYMRLSEARAAIRQVNGAYLVSLQNVMTIELERLRQWENIFAVLTTGRLHRDLIGFNKLKGILNELKRNLQGRFDFAIPDEDFSLYYSLPLLSHIIMDNKDNSTLFVHMRIPLRYANRLSKFDLITPHAYPFPCFNKECFVKPPLPDGNLQMFDLKQTSYLYLKHTKEIVHEINLDYLTCLYSLNRRLCYTFFPTLLQSPSACTNAIYAWNEEEVVKWCDFRSVSREQYKVIPVQYNQFMIHKDVVDKLHQDCGSDRLKTINIENWAVTLEIPEFCNVFVPATNQLLYGPFSKVLRKSTFQGQVSYHSKLIKKIYEKYRNITVETMPVPEGFIERNEENANASAAAYREMNKTLSAGQVSRLAQFLAYAQARLNRSIKELETKVNFFRYSSTFWGYFSLVGDSVQMLTTLIVIFGILSYTRIFGIFTPAIVIIEPVRVDCWDIQLIPDIKLLPDVTIDVMNDTVFISWIMNIAFVTSMVT